MSLGVFMLNWSNQSIPPAEMLVMRRVAVEMRTIHGAKHGAKEVEFEHDVCSGLVRYEKTGVFGAVGGLFFFGDFGMKNERPNTVDFFIPRYELHRRGGLDDLVHTRFTMSSSGEMVVSYPDDIDAETARGAGKLRVRVRKAE